MSRSNKKKISVKDSRDMSEKKSLETKNVVATYYNFEKSLHVSLAVFFCASFSIMEFSLRDDKCLMTD